MLGDFRLETGVNYPALDHVGRADQPLHQDARRLGPVRARLAARDLDVNGNGQIGYLEMHRGSPVRGNISAANQPLSQRFNWPKDANGNYLPIDQFPTVAGIPQSMYDYLVAIPRPTRRGCCVRKESAVRCRPRDSCRSAWCSIRAPSVTTRSTCGAPIASSAISRRT